MVQRLWWWVLPRVYGRRTAAWGTLRLTVVDARYRRDRSPAALVETASQALRAISRAKGGFGEIVTAHLAMVVVMPVAKGLVLPIPGAFVLPSNADEVNDPRSLAANLIWAATSMRLARNRWAQHEPVDATAVRDAAFAARERFLAAHDDDSLTWT